MIKSVFFFILKLIMIGTKITSIKFAEIFASANIF